MVATSKDCPAPVTSQPCHQCGQLTNQSFITDRGSSFICQPCIGKGREVARQEQLEQEVKNGKPAPTPPPLPETLPPVHGYKPYSDEELLRTASILVHKSDLRPYSFAVEVTIPDDSRCCQCLTCRGDLTPLIRQIIQDTVQRFFDRDPFKIFPQQCKVEVESIPF